MPAFRFCPQCAGPLLPPGKPGDPQACAACGAVHWRNSKPCVGAVVLRDGRVLLSKRAREPAAGLWDVPGGFLDWGEAPLSGLKRELREETGLDVRPQRLLAVAIGTYEEEKTLNLLYLCDADGEPRAGDDSAELAWFPLDALPPLAFRHEEEILRRLPR